MKKVLLLPLFLIIMFSNMYIVNANSVKGSNSKVSVTYDGVTAYYDTLDEALSFAPDNTLYEIDVLENITLNEKHTIPANKNIVIDGNGFSITRGKNSGVWYNGNILTINKSALLTIKNINYDDGNSWEFKDSDYEDALANSSKISDKGTFLILQTDGSVATDYIINNKGTLVIEGCTFKNHYSADKGFYFANTADSLLTIKDSKVSHFATKSSGAILNISQAKVIIEKGTIIDDNFVGGNGGLFKVYSRSEIVMNGGEIKNTKSVNANGIVAMMYLGIFTMNDGIVSNNTGVSGGSNGRIGTFYLHNGGQFIMNGGIIENNIGVRIGGIDVAGYVNSVIQFNKGIIRNNEVSDGSHGKTSDIYVGNDYDLVIGEGMNIEGNISVDGNLTNNGIINGDVTLDITNGNDSKTIDGLGVINGDIVIYYDKEGFSPEIEKYTVNGNLVFCEVVEQILLKFYYNGGIDKNGLTDHGILSVNNGDVVIPPEVTKKGYNVEWYLDEELTEKWDNVVLPDRSHLFAKWIPNEYKITFAVNGNETVEVMNYGDVIKLPKDPKKDGYIFDGWENYTEGMTVPDHDITFTALFSIKNPQTSDNIIYYMISAVISFITTIVSLRLLIINHSKKNEA